MSECVVRMDIPENCFVCPFRLGCSAYRAYSFSTSTRRVLPKPLDEGCNILAVLPEGHGRLVDAEEMYKKSEAFCNQYRQGEHDCEKCNYIVAQGYMYKSHTIVQADTEERMKTV